MINSPLTTVRRPIPWSTMVGLGLSLLAYPAWQWVIGPAVEPFFAPISFVVFGQSIFWLIALGVLAISVYGERKSLASLGLRPLSWRMAVVGIALGVALSALLSMLAMAVHAIVPASAGGTINSNSAKAPAWVWLLIVLTAAVVEEVLFRAYPFERLA